MGEAILNRTTRKRKLLVTAGLVAGGLALVTALSVLGGCKGASSRLVLPPVESDAALIGKATQSVKDAQRLEIEGKNKEAMDKYREAINTYHDMPVAWNNLGRLLMMDSEAMQAAEAFKTAAELSPSDPVAMYNLGCLWESRNWLEDAAKWYDQAIVRDPNYLPALRRRVIIDQKLDRVDKETFEDIRRALLLEKDPWWIDRLQRARLRLQQTEKSDNASKATSPDRAPESMAQ